MTRKDEIYDKMDELRKATREEVRQIWLEHDGKLAALRAKLKEVENG